MFTGMISVFMPSQSWVVKWNKLEGVKPGIYAIRLIGEVDNSDIRDN